MNWHKVKNKDNKVRSGAQLNSKLIYNLKAKMQEVCKKSQNMMKMIIIKDNDKFTLKNNYLFKLIINNSIYINFIHI